RTIAEPKTNRPVHLGPPWLERKTRSSPCKQVTLDRSSLRKHGGGLLLRSILAVRAVLRSMSSLVAAGLQPREVLEHRVRSLEPLSGLRHEERDLVLTLPVLLARRHLARDEVHAQFRQALAHR